ncbi:MAG: sigma-70 family RNA polymerase sigma factor [Candidatus Marinimicrobia bacterium]|nr:sigma-70 family RNA polymerase sigma factor [Candidatus Neomarinimicrobiota bacterium]
MGDDKFSGVAIDAEQHFNRIVLKYGERIYRTVRGMVGTHEDADDIVQETFLKAYKNIDSFRGEADIGTWLTRIALNLTYTKTRRKKLFSDNPVDDYVDRISSNTDLPEVSVEENERRMMVENGLKTLPEKQRAVFVLRMYEEMKFKEIAALMGTSESTSRANFHQALTKLKKFVSEKS